MTENQVRKQIQRTVDTCFSDLQGDPRLAQRIRNGAEGKIQVKKKLSFGLILAIAVMLVIAGAVAAVIHWNVMDFLFGGPNPQADILVKDIEAQATDGQVTLTINSALCDGESLALDWTVCNTKPEQPVYLQIDRFYANGVKLWSDGTDSFDYQWLPGWCSDGTMQDGENILLPEEITGELMTVEISVGVYSPKKPVYLMDTYDEQAAERRIAQGYYVIAEGDGFVMPDPETGGLMHCFGGIPEGALDDFERTELNISFDLNLSAAQAACRELAPQSTYLWDGLTARYTRAQLTPAALYLTLEISGGEMAQYDGLILDGRFELTDGEGNPFEHPLCQMETGGRELPDGTAVISSAWQCFGITAEELPDTLSITFISEDGSVKHTFPIDLK